MRLVSFTPPHDGPTSTGVLVPLGAAIDTHTHVVDLVSAFLADNGGAPLTGGMRQLLTMKDGLLRAHAAAEDGRWRTPLASVTLQAPISDPEKIICGVRIPNYNWLCIALTTLARSQSA